jgi:hypothetical protein
MVWEEEKTMAWPQDQDIELVSQPHFGSLTWPEREQAVIRRLEDLAPQLVSDADEAELVQGLFRRAYGAVDLLTVCLKIHRAICELQTYRNRPQRVSAQALRD